MKFVDLNEALKIGIIQEVNRRLLHPMGMALCVIQGEGKDELEIIDHRDDPEGMYFGEHILSEDKMNMVNKMFEDKRNHRENILGYHIQPCKRED